jgi:hypothetical protein
MHFLRWFFCFEIFLLFDLCLLACFFFALQHDLIRLFHNMSLLLLFYELAILSTLLLFFLIVNIDLLVSFENVIVLTFSDYFMSLPWLNLFAWLASGLYTFCAFYSIALWFREQLKIFSYIFVNSTICQHSSLWLLNVYGCSVALTFFLTTFPVFRLSDFSAFQSNMFSEGHELATACMIQYAVDRSTHVASMPNS